jgi:hypothetical protein
MKKLIKISCLLFAIISFSGCVPSTRQGWIDLHHSESASMKKLFLLILVLGLLLSGKVM